MMMMMMVVVIVAVMVVCMGMMRSNDDVYLLISNTAFDDTDSKGPNQYVFLSTALRHNLHYTI